jgi:hypothetical protein
MNDLDELMSRDPLSLSDSDIDEIIRLDRLKRAKKLAKTEPAKSAIDVSSILDKYNSPKDTGYVRRRS